MFNFTTSIPNGIGSYSHSDETRKRKKRHPNWKGGSKSVTADDIIVYIENHIASMSNSFSPKATSALQLSSKD